MSPLTLETRRLLDLSRGADDPPPSRERRVHDRLVARLGVAALAGAAAGSAAGSAGAATTATALSASGASSAVVGSAGGGAGSLGATTTTLAKTILGLTLAAGIGASSLPLYTSSEPSVDALERAIEASLPALTRPPSAGAGRDPDLEVSLAGADSPRPVVAVVDESVDRERSRHEALMAIARRPDHPVAIESELVLVERAEQAFAAHDYQRASGYLDRHDAKYRAGALRDTREALRILIDCAAGAADRARDGAARFARTFPHSEQLRRVRACRSTVEPPQATPDTDEKAPGTDQTSNF
jgi:hypothetical protein